jgi:hypothetical protein
VTKVTDGLRFESILRLQLNVFIGCLEKATSYTPFSK